MITRIVFGFLALSLIVSGDILSIDLGSQFFKVALVSTGKFEIVPNLQSKRKTPTAMSTKTKVREFGDDALLAQAKSPSKVATFFRWLIGANFTSSSPDSLFPSEVVAPFAASLDPQRQSALFGNEDFGHRSIEDILANIIWYSKNLVEEHDTPSTGRAKVGSLKDLVITVPSWATRQQRQAVLDAAKIAGFPRVSLVHETSAASVQRAFDMNVTSETNTMYLNMGAGHFESCVVQYNTVGSGSFQSPTVRVLGCSYSLKAGGNEVSRGLAQEASVAFIKKFPKVNAKEFSQDPIGKVRLFRQAEQVKQTLSANKETVFSVESLWDELDLKHHVSRGDVERLSGPVIAEIEKVISKTLARCNLTKSDIHQVEVIGGGWRIPHVQTKLESIFDPLPVGQHLNGDEAMVFGGAFIAANASSSFRVRKVIFTDISENEYSIQISPRSVPEGEDAKWPRTQTIFPLGHKLGSTKAIKLTVNSDLDVDLIENGNLIESIHVSGARNDSLSVSESPQIVLKVKLDPSGIFEISGAEAVHERMEEQTMKIPLNTTNEKNETEYNVTTIMVPKRTRINLKIDRTFEAKPLAMTEEQIKASRDALKTVIAAENAIKLRTKTKNDLESLIYSLRDKMEDDERVKKHSSDEERSEILKTCNTAEEWLDDNGFSATVEEFKEQVATLSAAAKPIFDRIDEERKQKEAEELARKIQEELERKAAQDETTATNETDSNSTTLPELEIPEEARTRDVEESNDSASNQGEGEDTASDEPRDSEEL